RSPPRARARARAPPARAGRTRALRRRAGRFATGRGSTRGRARSGTARRRPARGRGAAAPSPWRGPSPLHRSPRPSSDPVPQDSDPLDLQLDLVARPEPALVAVLEDAAGADGAGADHVARPQLGVPRRVGDDRLPRVVHVAEVAAGALLAVHPRDHLEAQVAELVGGDDEWA